VSSYIAFRHSTLTEWEFLSAVAEEADCGILLDVNNIFVSAFNHRFNAETYIDSVPAERVVQFHLAGHQDHGKYLLDTHDRPLREEVWRLYERAVRRFGRVSALIEWDDNLPEFGELQANAEQARRRHEVLIGVEAGPPCVPVSNEPTPADWRMDDALDLKSLQAFLYRLMTAPEGVDGGLAAEKVLPAGGLDAIIVGDDRLSSRERVEIYANAYFYRLFDVFKEDFPATLAVIGATNLHNLITGYLIDHPPIEPEIQYAGRHLPDFIRTHPLRQRWPFIADLAHLERAMIEVLQGPDAEPLDAGVMRTVAPAEWPAIQLRAHPCLRILELGWHIDTVRRAIENGASWEEPAHGATAILVWRRKSQVHYRALERGEHEAIALAQSGATFAAICDAIVGEVGDEDEGGPVLINGLLERWLGDGVLVRGNSWAAPPDAAS
jgi:hypothetical protein